MLSRPRVERLIEAVHQAYHKSRWHSFQAAVRGLTEEEALWQPPAYKGFSWSNGSILQIIFHVGADKLVQMSHAFGEGSLDWNAAERRFKGMGANLHAALQIAQEGYEAVLDALEALSDEDLLVERPIWGGHRMPTGEVFQMLVEHDYYHAGQIRYVRCLYAGMKEKGLL